jgi:hypothetical protein
MAIWTLCLIIPKHYRVSKSKNGNPDIHGTLPRASRVLVNRCYLTMSAR